MTSPKPTPEALERAREWIRSPAGLGLRITEDGWIESFPIKVKPFEVCVALLLTAELERGKALGARECAEAAHKRRIEEARGRGDGEHAAAKAAAGIHRSCLAIANKHEGEG